MYAAQYRVLVGRKIDHAIGDDDIETSGIQFKFIEALNIALEETYIRITQDIGVEAAVLLGDSELLVGHIDAHHFARWADEL